MPRTLTTDERVDLVLRFMVSEFNRVGYVQNDDDAPKLAIHLCDACEKPAFVGLHCLYCGAGNLDVD